LHIGRVVSARCGGDYTLMQALTYAVLFVFRPWRLCPLLLLGSSAPSDFWRCWTLRPSRIRPVCGSRRPRIRRAGRARSTQAPTAPTRTASTTLPGVCRRCEMRTHTLTAAPRSHAPHQAACTQTRDAQTGAPQLICVSLRLCLCSMAVCIWLCALGVLSTISPLLRRARAGVCVCVCVCVCGSSPFDIGDFDRGVPAVRSLPSVPASSPRPRIYTGVCISRACKRPYALVLGWWSASMCVCVCVCVFVIHASQDSRCVEGEGM
jgi:hypothetical protein